MVRYMLTIKPCCSPLALAGIFWVSLNVVGPLSSLCFRKRSAIDVAVDYSTDSYDMYVPWKLVEKELALTFDPGLLVPQLHHRMLAETGCIPPKANTRRK